MSQAFKSVKIGRRSLRCVCSGEDVVTVVVDVGMGISAEHGLTRSHALGWAKVFRELERATRVCMYDRAGVGQSDPVHSPRTSLDMVKDLHALLKNAAIPGPYVLVGHSIGGFNALLYAHEYPKEVAGLALVDSTHPDQQARFDALLPPQAAKEPSFVRALRSKEGLVGAEGFDMVRSAEQVRSIASLGNLPLVVVSRSLNQPVTSETPAELAAAVEAAWAKLQTELLSLSTRSSHLIAEHAGHNIQLDDPQLVIGAILKVVHTLRLEARVVH